MTKQTLHKEAEEAVVDNPETVLGTTRTQKLTNPIHYILVICTYPTDQPTIVPVIYASFAEAVVRYCW